ncbi:MlaD family protein [Desulfobacca acetoxidans]|uniref:Mammalian cell entry related domain protein n=1 Tax=Desulfobacca acetoxidans (strain ATCC 700848 / DSM 11109 / ASRB2) TaxID=880072 RepID=F2NFS5_DESAR|nr:MlaD family protein [Desulfobacca acetoxidans]AEB10194.1 Mammalian cell entry related domain protein [Desulfobacca acetoxidans DSM 11109]
MAKQANRMMIGVFVVLAVILMAASLVVFGSGKFFKKTVKCVLYFDESVKGLNVGAPVLFQGVQIGSVTSIVLQVDPAKLQPQIPVTIEFEPDRFKVHAEGGKIPREPRKNIAKLIDKGLRAVLTMQSFITGQLMIEIDFHPGTPVVLKNIGKDFIEIPTIPSTSERLAQTLDKLDLEGLKKHLESTLAGIDRFVNGPDLIAGIRALKDTLQDVRKIVVKMEGQINPLADDVKKSVKDIGKLARNAEAKLDPLGTGLDKTMSSVRGIISEDSPLIVELQNTMKEISAMSRSFRQLANYLEQHPETVIRGKKSPGGK